MTSFRSTRLALTAILLGLAWQPMLATCPTCSNASFGPAIRGLRDNLTYATSIVVARYSADAVCEATARFQIRS